MDKSKPVAHYSVNPSPSKGEIQVLSGGFERCESGTTESFRIIDAVLIHHVLSGKGLFHYMDSLHLIEAGHSFFIFPGDLYKYSPDPNDPWTYRFIALKGSKVVELLNNLGITSANPVIRPGMPKRAAFLFQQIHKALKQLAPGFDYEAGGYTRLLFAEYAKTIHKQPFQLAASQGEKTRSIKEAVRWMQNNYSQAVSLETMVQQQGYSLDYFTRQFKSSMGCTPKEYLIKLRMENAKSLLYSNLPVKEIAERVGYSDPYYFSRLFKKTFQLSPEQFRKTIPII